MLAYIIDVFLEEEAEVLRAIELGISLPSLPSYILLKIPEGNLNRVKVRRVR